MSKSLLQEEKACYITGSTSNLHRHHCFGSFNRKKSEKYGMWIYLRSDWHNLSDYGIHFDKELDLRVKRLAQALLEAEEGWNRERFIKEFGRSWL